MFLRPSALTRRRGAGLPAADAECVAVSGVRYRIRPVRPSDKGRFQRAFNRLSELSRYRRFLAHKQRLSAAELRFFTEVDGNDHFAVVALEQDASGRDGEAVGSARFIRLDGQPDAAEIAVTVVDSHQGRGIGRSLLERLLKEAYRRGIRRIRVHLLADNLPIRKLLESVLGKQKLDRDGNLISGDFPLHAGAAGEDAAADAPLFRLLRLAAAGSVMPVNFALNVSRAQLAALKARVAAQRREEEPEGG